LKDFERVIS